MRRVPSPSQLARASGLLQATWSPSLACSGRNITLAQSTAVQDAAATTPHVSITIPGSMQNCYVSNQFAVTGNAVPSAAFVHSRAASGRIELIMGAMFAGKTSELLHRVRKALLEERCQVLVIKSDKDTRYARDQIVTHTGDRLNCIPVATLHQLLDISHAASSHYAAAHVIAIDEAQFFPDLAEFVIKAADEHKKRVIVAGLDGDFKRQRFGQLLDLVPMADQIDKLRGRCFVPGCEHKALFSLRIRKDDRQELVGGADTYQPACRQHYLAHQKQK